MSCLNAGSSNSVDKKNVSQNSEDSSSSTEDDTRAVILTNDRGTSSLQLSDSEEEQKANESRANFVHFTRRRNNPGEPHAGNIAAASAAINPDQPSNAKKLINVDTDSVNENFSPVRPSTKRKRKFKRMALDPDGSVAMETLSNVCKSKTGTIKRKKVRSKSACDSGSAKSRYEIITNDLRICV